MLTAGAKTGKRWPAQARTLRERKRKELLMNTKTILLTVLAGTLVASVCGVVLTAAESQSSSRRAATQAFMRQKLALTQTALEGLALERFDVVSKNAIRLRDMAQNNQWLVMKQPDYLARTTNFQKSADALYLAAVDKNLETATEAYTQLARNCVDCHRLVRLEQRKNAGKPLRPEPAPNKPVLIP